MSFMPLTLNFIYPTDLNPNNNDIDSWQATFRNTSSGACMSFMPETLNPKSQTQCTPLTWTLTQIVAGNLPEHELAGLHELFKSMDKDGNGTITVRGGRGSS